MDFYRRQEQARRVSRWLVAVFGVAVTLVVLAVNAIVLTAVAMWTGGGDALWAPRAWLGSHPGTVWLTTAIVVATVVGSSLWKLGQLRAGGRIVARDLGARLVRPDAGDPDQRRLLNVVEEMAIAASVPVPAVYVLESPAINALAAGYAPAEASIIVTRGALLALDRPELQGVIGHEFSHILSGDMRLNTRLVGFLHGLFVVSELGRLLGPRAGASRNARRAGLFGWLGVALFIVGAVGLFTGRLIQAAVARQRERLADASAVQFTRESRGLRNALVKIGAHKIGSRMAEHGMDRLNHMLFASPGRLDFATHPPLLERIRALDPSFQSAEFGNMRHVLDARAGEPAGGAAVSLDARATDRFSGDVPADAAAIAALVGNPGPAQFEFAEDVSQALPDFVRQATASPETARALLLAMATGTREPDQRLQFVRRELGDALADSVGGALANTASLDPLERLPAVLLLIGVLREAPVAERQHLIAVLNGLLNRGGTPTVFEYALRKSVATFLNDGLYPARDLWPLSLRTIRDDLRFVLSIVAGNGADNDAAAAAAFLAGWARLQLPPVAPAGGLPAWVGPMDRAMARVDRLTHRDKEQVVQALVVTIAHDGRVNVAEAELLRLLCALLHCPLPPLLVSAVRL